MNDEQSGDFFVAGRRILVAAGIAFALFWGYFTLSNFKMDTSNLSLAAVAGCFLAFNSVATILLSMRRIHEISDVRAVAGVLLAAQLFVSFLLYPAFLSGHLSLHGPVIHAAGVILIICAALHCRTSILNKRNQLMDTPPDPKPRNGENSDQTGD